MKLWVLFFVAAVWTLAPTEGRAGSKALLKHVKRSASLLSERRPSYDIKRSVGLSAKHMRRQVEEEEEDDNEGGKPIHFDTPEDMINSQELKDALKGLGITMDDVKWLTSHVSDMLPEKGRAEIQALSVLSLAGYDIEPMVDAWDEAEESSEDFSAQALALEEWVFNPKSEDSSNEV